jgi:DNA-binding GntR family transcriptional regulator
LEEGLVAGAAARFGPEHSAALTQSLDRMRDAADAGQIDLDAEHAFHAALWSAVDNKSGRRIAECVWDSLAAAIGRRAVERHDAQACHAAHAAIADALARGDSEAVRRALRADYERLAALVPAGPNIDRSEHD